MQILLPKDAARELIRQRMSEGEALKQAVIRNSDADGWANKVQHSVGRILGDDPDWVAKFLHRSGTVVIGNAGRNAILAQEAVGKTLLKLQSLLDIIEEESELPVEKRPAVLARSNRIFVVHGHDEYAREAVASFLRLIGFEPIILHEQANRGRTVIEKVEAHGDVGFAVVLLTPDDLGRSTKEADLEPRARQNVLLELGYFIGRLNRENVCALKRGEVAIPSDFAGVVYHDFDQAGAWKMALGRELEEADYAVDWNVVMRSGKGK